MVAGTIVPVVPVAVAGCTALVVGRSVVQVAVHAVDMRLLVLLGSLAPAGVLLAELLLVALLLLVLLLVAVLCGG